MPKTIKELLEVYRPKSPDEQKFVDKHVTIKHKDRNGNGDDVFKATNVKTVKRSEDGHGYDAGDDEKVYEEVEEFEESYDELIRLKNNIARNQKKMNSIQGIHPEKKRLATQIEKDTKRHKELFNKVWGKNESVEMDDLAFFEDLLEMNLDEDTFTDASLANLRVMKHKQMMKDIEKSSKIHPLMKVRKLSDARKKLADLEAARDHYVAKHEKAQSKKKKVAEEVELDEKTLTPAEMKKREEIVKAVKRENPGMDKSMAYAIATKTAKRVAEEVEDLDELSKETLGNYIKDASRETQRDAAYAGSLHRAKKDTKLLQRRKGIDMAVDKLTREEVEDLDEGLMHDRYLRSHGKKARGSGSWAFTTKQFGSPKEHEMHFTSGQKSLSDAHKEAAAKLGTKHLYVMEEVEELDEKFVVVDRNKKIMHVHSTLSGANKKAQAKGLDPEEHVYSHSYWQDTYGPRSMRKESTELDEARPMNNPEYDESEKAWDARRKDWEREQARKERAKKNKMTEEVEDLDELSKNTLARYAGRAMNDVRNANQAKIRWQQKDGAKDYHLQNPKTGSYEKKTAKEMEDEHSRVARNREKGVRTAIKKLAKEDIINRAIEKYMPEDYTPPSIEERFLSKIVDLPEAHAVTLLALFDSLNEQNKMIMIESVETEEGVNALLDFAINNRGE